MPDQQIFQMRVAVVLAGAMMPIIHTVGSQLLQPFVDIRNQSRFGIVDIHTGGNMHRADHQQSLANTAFAQRPLDLIGDIQVFAAFAGIKGQIFRVAFHQIFWSIQKETENLSCNSIATVLASVIVS